MNVFALSLVRSFNFIFLETATGITKNTRLFPFERLVHFTHARVSTALHGSAVDVESVLRVVHDKHTHVTHTTQIHKLLNLILDKSLVD